MCFRAAAFLFEHENGAKRHIAARWRQWVRHCSAPSPLFSQRRAFQNAANPVDILVITGIACLHRRYGNAAKVEEGFILQLISGRLDRILTE
jgi:hypothetical protein